MGTSAGCGSVRETHKRSSEPARHASPAMPSRPSVILSLQQPEIARQRLVEVVVLLEEGRVRVAIEVADEGALLGHVLGELRLARRLLAGIGQLRDDVRGRVL